MEISAFKVRLSGRTCLVGVLDFVLGEEEKAPPRTHHVWVLDRSGSMYRDIDDLMDRVKQARAVVPPNDLLSIFYFSGPGVFSEVVVGASPTGDVDALIDRIRSTLGTTCFSEVLEKVVGVCEKFRPLVDQTEVTLFTDGQPVVPWRDERARSVGKVRRMVEGSALSAFNAVGYTPYYDREFLNDLVAQTDHGRFVHARDIEGFLAAVVSNMEAAGNLVRHSAEVIPHGDGDVLYFSGKTSAMRAGEIGVDSLNADRNTFYCVFDGSVSPRAMVAEDGADSDVDFGAARPASDASRGDFLYVYAARLFSAGRRAEALDVLADNLRDKGLSERVMNAYTSVEAAEVQVALDDAAADPTLRLADGVTPDGFRPREDAFCLMDLFARFFREPGKAMWLPFSDRVSAYKRIGRKVEDLDDRFVSAQEEVRQEMGGFVWSDERLNLSVRVTRNGSVRLNPRSAERVGLPAVYPCTLIRTYTVVKDGTLNIPKMEFLIEDGLLWELVGLGAKVELGFHSEVIDGEVYQRALFDLTKLPIINRKSVKDAEGVEALHEMVESVTAWEARQKVVSDLLKGVKEASRSLGKQNDFKSLTVDQIEVLKEHGVSDKGVYSAVQPVRPKVEDAQDFYETRKMAFYIKGAASLPSKADFTAMLAYEPDPDNPKKVKAGKKPNYAGALMVAYRRQLDGRLAEASLDLDKPTVALRDYLEAEAGDISRDLSGLRQRINRVKLAKALTNDFFPGLADDGKGNFIHEMEGHGSMVLAVSRVKEYL